jgi:hypothetical protein
LIFGWLGAFVGGAGSLLDCESPIDSFLDIY